MTSEWIKIFEINPNPKKPRILKYDPFASKRKSFVDCSRPCIATYLGSAS